MVMASDKLTFEECAAKERGFVFVDRFDEGVRFLILRGGVSLTAYVGVPESHPLAGFSYDDVPIECHGGLTFGDSGDGKFHPKGFYWYGWDYSHCGDFSFCDLDRTYDRPVSLDEKKWTVADVENDSWSAIWSFKKLMALAERCANKTVTK
jgi:hypothetical protein